MLAKADTVAQNAGGIPAPRGVVFVPTEKVLLLAVEMAGTTPAQRRAAVGFAVEGMIARPLDEVRVVLGPALPGGQSWLVAVFAPDVVATDAKARLIPDVLALPLPAPGHWSVWEEAGRNLIRTPDGAGFACDAAALPYYHLAAGRPAITLFSGQLDPQFPIHARATLPASIDPAFRQFDLTQSPTTGLGTLRKWRPLAAVAAFAALAHLGLLATDVWALHRISAQMQADLRTSLAQLGQPAEGDLDTTLSTIIAQAGGTTGPRFVTLAAQAFAAIAPEQGRITTSDLRYTADQNSLTLQLQAPDIATLQSVETALRAAGFQINAGAATTRDGLAEQEISLAGGGA
jgi:general secretion pathway protein L